MSNLNYEKINNYKEMLLTLLEKHEDRFEFICALANAKSELENTMATEVHKKTIEIHMKSMMVKHSK